MAFVLVFFSLVLGTIAGYQLSTLPKSDATTQMVAGYNPATSSLMNEYVIRNDERQIIDENRTVARNANIAAIRVCRQVSYEMHVKFIAGDTNCSGYATSTLLYGYLGTAGTKGSIDTLYSKPVSATLSCATPDTYGRYLFSRSLPAATISGKNVSYNLIGVTDGHGDPCGFHELLF